MVSQDAHVRNTIIKKQREVITKSPSYWGTWLVHVVEHATLGLRMVSSSPMLDMEPT